MSFVECGLFVYVENGTLAASPDGLVEKDGILEVKCINCKPEDVPNRPDKFLQRVKPSDELQINKKHKYYYQIIMQLYVCLLYTSDAADDLTRVDLGGRRIIK